METQREKKIRQVLRLFMQNQNGWLTAIDINRIVNTSDARKIISVLIRNGFNIEKTIIDKRTGTKAYRLKIPEQAIEG